MELVLPDSTLFLSSAFENSLIGEELSLRQRVQKN